MELGIHGRPHFSKRAMDGPRRIVEDVGRRAATVAEARELLGTPRRVPA